MVRREWKQLLIRFLLMLLENEKKPMQLTPIPNQTYSGKTRPDFFAVEKEVEMAARTAFDRFFFSDHTQATRDQLRSVAGDYLSHSMEKHDCYAYYAVSDERNNTKEFRRGGSSIVDFYVWCTPDLVVGWRASYDKTLNTSRITSLSPSQFLV